MDIDEKIAEAESSKVGIRCTSRIGRRFSRAAERLPADQRALCPFQLPSLLPSLGQASGTVAFKAGDFKTVRVLSPVS